MTMIFALLIALSAATLSSSRVAAAYKSRDTAAAAAASSLLQNGADVGPSDGHHSHHHHGHAGHHQSSRRKEVHKVAAGASSDDRLHEEESRMVSKRRRDGQQQRGGNVDHGGYLAGLQGHSAATATAGSGGGGDGGGGGITDSPPYVPSNCSRCRMIEETLNMTKEAIKQQILSKLGLRQPPNITGRALPSIPPLNNLLDRYGMQSDAPGNFKPGPVIEEEEDDYHAKTEKVISFAQEAPPSLGIPSNIEVLYFKFSHSVMVNKVMTANLWVYLHPYEKASPLTTLVHVYKVQRTDQRSESIVQEHVDSIKVEIKPRKHNWVTVDIRKLVNEWFRNPHKNYGLVVQAYDNEGRQLVVTTKHPAAETSMMPFIEVRTMDESKRRTKRMIGLNCDEKSNEIRCCRYPLTVDFEEFGWDWIIAPKKYEANYCSGECPFVFLQKYPHTHLVQQANPSGSAGPCCAPRKMSPISMLYFDEDLNIIYGLLPGMVVERCGCS